MRTSVSTGRSGDPDDVAELRALGRSFRLGDEAAFAEAYERFSPLVFTAGLRATADRAAAAEITQQVFVEAWRGRERFDPALRPLPAWLTGITRHVVADHLAARRRDQQLLDRLRALVAPRSSRPLADAVVDGLVVADGLERLEEPRREALRLAYFAGLSHRQIAARLRMPLGTVKSHIRRGLVELQEILRESDDAS